MQQNLNKHLSVSPEVLFQRVGDESVLLDLASERYFSLNEVGTRVWELLMQNGSLIGVLAALAEEYDVPEDVLRTDIAALLAELAEAGLVRELPGDAPP